MKRLLILVAVLLCVPVLSVDGEKQKWISLFNGKDLTGWTPKIRGFELGVNHANTFRVKNGAMQVGYESYENFDNRFGHIFYKTPYSNYRFRMEYRFTGTQVPGGPGWAYRNSGIMLHCQDPKSMGKDQNFPVSIEVQLLGGREAGDRTTANLCTPGTNVVMSDELKLAHCISSKSKTYRGDQWVAVEVEVRGGEVIKHILDGDVVLQYDKPQLDPRDGDAKKLIKGDDLSLSSGYISLQSESHPVEFRKIELLPLK